MSARIDHAAEAERILARAVDQYSAGMIEESILQTRAVIAQVYATVALVEQQQIANLIALATGVDLTTGTGIARRASDAAHNALVSDPNGDLAPDIAAALGIGGEER